MSYAGFLKRFAAAFIDSIILTIGSMIGYIYGSIYSSSDVLGCLLGFLLGWVYYAIMESSPTQGTLGKMALGIKVTDLEGKRVSFEKATERYFGKIVSTLILLIGFIMVAFTKKKQGLHDMMAGCLVVNR